MNARNMVGCYGEFASYAHGTRGSAVISTYMHTPAKCRIYKGHRFVDEELVWAFPQPEPNPYQLEWDHLIEADTSSVRSCSTDEIQMGNQRR